MSCLMKTFKSAAESAGILAAVIVLSFFAGIGFMSGVVHAMKNHEASVVVFTNPKKPAGQGGL